MAKKPDAAETQPTFEQALEELDAIVHGLEDGQLGLAESLAQFERGVKLMRHCHDLLEGAERRVELLVGLDAQGNPVATPFAEASGEPLVEKAARRGSRRTAPPASSPETIKHPPEDEASMDVPPWEQ